MNIGYQPTTVRFFDGKDEEKNFANINRKIFSNSNFSLCYEMLDFIAAVAKDSAWSVSGHREHGFLSRVVPVWIMKELFL